MTRIDRCLLACALLALLALPSTADAFSWWKLDKLSGPEFQGSLLQMRLVCLNSDGNRFRVQREPTGQRISDREAKRQKAVAPLSSPIGGIYSFCPNAKNAARRRASLDANLGWLRAERDPRFAGGHRIHAITLGPSFSFRANEVFEIGTAAHWAWFFSKGLKPSRELMLEPVRVDIRFLKDVYKWDATATPPWWQEAFILRAGFIWFPDEFEDGQFGAPLDGDQGVRYLGVFVDLDPIFRK